MTDKCTHCKNGYLGIGDIECVNGVMIDIDVAHEGWQHDVAYPPAPCEACRKCSGSGQRGRGNCRACMGTGWCGGTNESQERLADWASRRPTMTMRERIARALRWDPSLGVVTLSGGLAWEDYLPDADAALTALAEPTEAMIAAGFSVSRHEDADIGNAVVADIWRAMVRAAKEEHS
jgi:hypothetical protein